MEEVKIELFIPGELKDEPIICNMIKNFRIEMKIIEASFSAESGWALLVVNGAKDELERMFEDLQKQGINVHRRQGTIIRTIQNEVYASKFMSEVKPARYVVQVAGLPKDAGIELSCVAYAG